MALQLGLQADAPQWQAIGPNSRLMRHQDGSQTVYRRTPGKKSLVKKNIGVNGKVRVVTHYHMDDHGNPRGCKIYDSQNNLMFKVSYGYQISTGRLLAEVMTHASKKDPQTAKPLVVSETRYTYDAQGNRSKPIVFTFVEGERAEDAFGKRKTTFPERAFGDEPKTANPNSNRISGGK